MQAHRPAPVAGRIALVGAAALTATLALAAPASAHAEVEADTPRALARNVTLSFVSEAESDTAGFTQLRIVLPEGITPADITLEEAPKGWKLKPSADGYILGGPALKTGVDAEHKVRVRQLPDAQQLAFKTVETYGDGKVSRWIELPTGGKEPEQPAPVLKLKAAAPGAKPLSPSPTTSPTPSTSPSTSTSPAPQAAEKPANEDDGSSAGPLIGGAVAAVLILGGGGWWLARRRASGRGTGPA